MIEAGKTVKFDYTLTVDGQVVDTSTGKQPLEYKHGEGKIIPGLEKEMEGLQVGDSKTVTVAAKDGYGEVNKEAFRSIPKSQIPPNIKLEEGLMVNLQTADGKALPAEVFEIQDDTVVLNFNHPLAGKELLFDVTIVEIN